MARPAGGRRREEALSELRAAVPPRPLCPLRPSLRLATRRCRKGASAWSLSTRAWAVAGVERPAEMALRMLVLKHLKNWSYEQLEWEVKGNLVYRHFCRIVHRAICRLLRKPIGASWTTAQGPGATQRLRAHRPAGRGWTRDQWPQDACRYDRRRNADSVPQRFTSLRGRRARSVPVRSSACGPRGGPPPRAFATCVEASLAGCARSPTSPGELSRARPSAVRCGDPMVGCSRSSSLDPASHPSGEGRRTKSPSAFGPRSSGAFSQSRATGAKVGQKVVTQTKERVFKGNSEVLRKTRPSIFETQDEDPSPR